jgi:ubiquinone/menaquinone biosynthesis C-methylase UbiE
MAIRSEIEIKKFWDENPVGSNFVEYEQNPRFYQNYDEFRYKTEGHILEEFDQIDFKNKKVLEIGLGQGADSMQIIDRGGIYYGIDITEESVRRVKERFEIFNRPFQEISVGNAVQIKYGDNNFDIVYSHGVIHHSPDIKKIVAEIYRVLKPGGKAIIMLYHKNSFNYHISIRIFRRAGLLLLWPFPFLVKPIAKITGESKERINKHKENMRKYGFSYLRMKNFIHRSTDGPDNIYSSVWTKKSAAFLFKRFKQLVMRVHFLNQRHLLGLQYLLPTGIKKQISNRYGWHLWIIATK